jgi:hypothetical protein
VSLGPIRRALGRDIVDYGFVHHIDHIVRCHVFVHHLSICLY